MPKPGLDGRAFLLFLTTSIIRRGGNSSAFLAEERSAVVSVVCAVLHRFWGLTRIRVKRRTVPDSLALHSPQASRSRRRTPDAPPSSGNQPFMLHSRLQNRAQPSSAVRGFSPRSFDGGVGLEAMARSWVVLGIVYAEA